MPARRAEENLAPVSAKRFGMETKKESTLSCEELSWTVMLGTGRTHQLGPWCCRQVALRHRKIMLRCLKAVQAGKVTSNVAAGRNMNHIWVN